MQHPSSLRRQLLLGIFVVSGFTGLIYESIWSHYLKLFLGHAAYAQSLVLAIFMGGMAIGSWLVARYSGRVSRLLWGYVLVEGIIGVLGIGFHRGFVGLSNLSFEHVIPALSSNAAIHAYKWTLAALLILPQSILLGMTFPLISGGIIRRWPDRPGETLSMLYFTNSLGAAVGVLVSGFVLIRAVGLPGTILSAGLLNVVLALAVWILVRSEVEPRPANEQPAAATGPQIHRWFLVAAFLTGAASFLYEIGWIRMLSLVLGSSSHSFELMLSSFIFGLALGGLWMRKRIDSITDPQRWLAFMMMLMGALAMLTLPAYNRTFDFMAWALHTFTPTESGYTAFNVVSQGIAMLIMLPTTFCAGTTLPLLTRALYARGSGERAIGVVYAANTLGAIVGTLAAIHVLLPLISVKGVIISGGTIHLALGISGLVLTRNLRPALRFGFSAACVLLVCTALFGFSLDPLRLTSSVYRTGLTSQPKDATVQYLRDGKTATISLLERDGLVSIATNGKPDAAIQMAPGPAGTDEITMVFAAALPLSMHPHPERVANIGFGSGLTSSTVLLSERVKLLDSVEIEPYMVEAARLGFGPRISRVFEDKRSRIVFEDAKTYFAMAREPYDLIISEPSNPWVSGVATLFSDEFYGRITNYLKPDGYFVQWVQIYETDISILASILKAMQGHFPHYAVYNTDDSNLLIVATRGSELAAPAATVFDSAALRAQLARVGIESIVDITQRRIGDERTIGPLMASFDSPKNSDFFPFVDLNAPRMRFMRRSALELPSLLIAPVPVVELLSLKSQKHRRPAPSANSQLSMDLFARRGLAVRDAVISGKLELLDPPIAIEIAALRAAREQCADRGVQQAWKVAAREVADYTTPTLGGDDLQMMWREISATPCYGVLEGSERLWPDFLAAVAQRDAATIAQLGPALLAQKQRTRADDRDYVVTALAAAQLGMGNIQATRELFASSTFEPGPAYQLPLRQLRAIVAAATPDSPADVTPAAVTENVRE